MGECPLCGELSYNARTRLIKDACGHTKCRLCLLQEENGCTICKDESNLEKTPPRIVSIGNFDYPQPGISSPSYNSIDCIPLELVVNKIPYNGECNNCTPVKEMPRLDDDDDDEESIQNKQDKETESKNEDGNDKNENQYYDKIENQINDKEGPNYDFSQSTQTDSQLNNISLEIVNKSLDIYESNCPSVERQLVINESIKENAQHQQDKEIEDEENKKNEQNIDNHNNTNENQIDNIEEQICHYSSSQIKQNKSHLNSTLVQVVGMEENIEINQTENSTDIVITDKNKQANCDQSNITTFVLVINRSLVNSLHPRCASISESLVINDNETTNQIVEINENENVDCNSPNKTPNPLVGCKSPDYRLSNYLLFNMQDEQANYNELITSPSHSLGSKTPEFRYSNYLLFNKLGEKVDHNQLIASPSHSVGSRSPEFRLSDYILFNNQGEKVDHNQLIASPAHSVGNRSPEFRLSDYLLVKKQGEIADYNQLIASPSHSIGYRSPEFRLSDYLLLNNKQSEKVTYNQQIASPFHSSGSRTPDPTNEIRTEKEQNEQLIVEEEDDEDKENKEDPNDEKEADIHVNKVNNLESVALACKDSSKYKTGNKNIKNQSNDIEIKSDIRQTKLKRKKQNGKIVIQLRSSTRKNKNKNSPEKQTKNNFTPLVVRRGERKRKCKVLLCEEDDAQEIKEPAPKRRAKNKDWSHIATLPGSPTTYKCTICNKVFKSLRSKSYHAGCLVGEASFCCEICDRTFAKRSHFEYHERTHSGHKPFQCQVCQKSFVQRNKLNRHMLSHKRRYCTAQNDLECNECGNKFNMKDNLKKHLDSHVKVSYKCQFCPKTFTLKPNRKRHELSHLSERKFKCDVCSQDFKNQYMLTRHKNRLHQKHRPFTCLNCQRVFFNKFELRRHMISHYDEKPFSCEQCDLQFRRKDNLNRHVKHHHPEEPPDEPPNQAESTSKNENETKNRNENDNESESESKNKNDNETEQALGSPCPSLSSYETLKSPASRSKGKSSTPRRVSISSARSKLGSPTGAGGPINIKRFPESGGGGDSARHRLTEPIPLEEALVLNRRIEMMYTQSSFCNYPGLTRRMNASPAHGFTNRRRDSCSSNSNSNDGVSFTSKQNQEKSKARNKEETNNTHKNNESKIIRQEVIVQHWRRRTAESLKSQMAKKK